MRGMDLRAIAVLIDAETRRRDLPRIRMEVMKARKPYRPPRQPAPALVVRDPRTSAGWLVPASPSRYFQRSKDE